MKLHPHPFLALLATFALWVSSGSLSHGVGINLRLNGYDDVSMLSTILVTDGFDAFVGIVVDRGHEEEIEETAIDWDEWGEPIAWDEPEIHWIHEYTVYRADLPSEWLGRGIAFSQDGTNWTSFRLFNGNDPSDNAEQEITIEGEEWGDRTLPDPDSYTDDLGNRLRLGRMWADASRNVFSLTSWDNDIEAWPAVGMDIRSSTANTFWRWFHPTDDGAGTQLVMVLDHEHRLSLRGRTNAGSIVLDPERGRILVNGKTVVTGGTGVLGDGGLSSSNSAVRIGRGTEGRNQGDVGQIVLGSYNRTTTDGTSGVLIVGTGSSPNNSQRKNGLRILDDGTVLIWPKDDLPMAAQFRNGPTP